MESYFLSEAPNVKGEVVVDGVVAAQNGFGAESLPSADF